ncbi:hypothetical protein ACE3LM_22550 [Enterobacter hormaechei subsp. steigerwaltii]
MSTITKERIANLLQFNSEGSDCQANAEQWEVHELARIALASLEAKPVSVNDDMAYAFHHAISDSSLGSDEVEEIKAGLRAAFANVTAPPAPASVPEWTNEQCLEFLSIAFRHAEIKGDLELDDIRLGVKMVNGSRAAMLQGAELVKAANKLPDDFDFDRFNDVVWLEAVASNPHMHSPTTSTIAMVALELNRKLADGKSPVIPDGWVLVPVEPTAEMISSGITAHYERSQIQIHDRPAPGPMECAYVAMLAAAPQQEAKNV